MHKTLRALTLALLTLGLLLVAPAGARADDDTPSDWRIARYDATARFDRSGQANVTVNFDFDFGATPGHGPFLTLVERQRVAGNPDVWRLVDITLGEVTSPSGAPADVDTTHEDGSLVIRIGDPNVEVSGVQSYSVTYTATGLIAPNQAVSGMDEVNWNVIGLGWQVPLDDVSATVTGPTNIHDAKCWWGASYTDSCTVDATAATATYQRTHLEPGEGLQAVAGFPAGTFTDAEPVYAKRYHVGNLMPLNPVSGAIAGLGTVLGVGLVLLRTRRSARDEVYLGLTPGVRPAPGAETKVGRRHVSAPVAVAFTPPKNTRPGEIGVLVDATADDVDVTATIVDLAVRGHFQISEAGKDNWRFTRRASAEPLTPAEQHLVEVLFREGGQVTTADLRDKGYHELLPGARSRLYDRVTRDLRWFVSKPSDARVLAVVLGMAIVLLGLVVGVVLAFVAGLGLAAVPFVVTGVLVMALSHRFPRRTAEGSAVLAEAKGFELYLRTAEADQIRFEEGIDVFSRYLPYAIVFGVADRWAKIFADLAAEGRYRPADWYVGPHGYFYGSAFGHSLHGLTGNLSSSMHAAVNAQTAATSGSSGGSGFSGGGGFGGGGGGGW